MYYKKKLNEYASKCTDPEPQQMRYQDEVRQYKLFQKSKEKGYYIPAQSATESEISIVKQQVSQGYLLGVIAYYFL